MWHWVEFEELLGKTIKSIAGVEIGSERIVIETSDGASYQMFHDADCCESVSLNDVAGDIADLIGSPLVIAEKSTSGTNPEGVAPEWQDDSFTWTFYRLGTVNGIVVLRWYGSSNGYYSEDVAFIRERGPQLQQDTP